MGGAGGGNVGRFWCFDHARFCSRLVWVQVLHPRFPFNWPEASLVQGKPYGWGFHTGAPGYKLGCVRYGSDFPKL